MPEEVKFSLSFQSAWALYLPTLEGFLARGFTETITGRQVVVMLKTCPRLKTMVANSKYSGGGTKVCWRNFVRGRPTEANLPSDSQLLNTTWPCAETLTVLSIFLKVGSTMVSEEDSLQTAERVFQRLGQFKVLEDLSVGCNHKPVGYKRHSGAYRIEVSLNWTFGHGLGHLYLLRRLRRVDLERLWRHNVTREELEWMVKSWPNLEPLTGLAWHGDKKPTRLHNKDLQWIKRQLTGPLDVMFLHAFGIDVVELGAPPLLVQFLNLKKWSTFDDCLPSVFSFSSCQRKRV
ncbi:hypothetical protein BGZ54_007696 [Gamsiella multidivaricata]|nr:hypothetical protein BGZ54_007696 [Gamsiella multidivaricata]